VRGKLFTYWTRRLTDRILHFVFQSGENQSIQPFSCWVQVSDTRMRGLGLCRLLHRNA